MERGWARSWLSAWSTSFVVYSKGKLASASGAWLGRQPRFNEGVARGWREPYVRAERASEGNVTDQPYVAVVAIARPGGSVLTDPLSVVDVRDRATDAGC